MARFADEAYLKQWRKRQVDISMGSSVAHRLLETLMQMDEENESRKTFIEMLDYHVKNYEAAVTASATEDDEAYKLSYLRNFMFAYYKRICRKPDGGYDDFLEYFKFELWAAGDRILREKLGDEQCNAELKEAAEMDRYMMLTCHIYTNQLFRLAGLETRGVCEDGALINEYKELHSKYESKKWFDEIAAIRYQLQQLVAADVAEFYADEAAMRVWLVEGFELLNEFNTKPVQLDLAR